MSNYSVLKQDINNNIYENQTQQITGTVLNAILNEMTNSLGAGYQFAGVATLGLNPGDPDQRVFYLAGEGIYTNFGGLQVPAGKLGVLKWDNRWTLQTIDGLGGGGANLTGYVSVASTDDLPEEGQPTLGYLCGTNLYLYVGEGGDTKDGKYQNCGSFRGPEGAYIQDIEQTETSHENGGRNTIKMTLSDGRSFNAYVHNGTTSSGLFPTLAALQAAHPNPVVGQYAFVGAGFPADIYVCTTAGTWTDSGEDYDGDNVDLTNYATKTEVSELRQKIDGLVVEHFTRGGSINSSGTVTTNDTYCYSDWIPVSPSTAYKIDYGNPTDTQNLVEYNSDKSKTDYWPLYPSYAPIKEITTRSNSVYLRFSFLPSYNAKVYQGDTLIWQAQDITPGLEDRVEALEGEVSGIDSDLQTLSGEVESVKDNVAKIAIDKNSIDYGIKAGYEFSRISGTPLENITVSETETGINIAKTGGTNLSFKIILPQISKAGTYHIVFSSNKEMTTASIYKDGTFDSSVQATNNVCEFDYVYDGTYVLAIGTTMPYNQSSQDYSLVATIPNATGETVVADNISERVQALEDSEQSPIPASVEGTNTFIGDGAGQNNTPIEGSDNGKYNTAVGKNAMRYNTLGDHNSAFGFCALNKNQDGRNNTALGEDALYENLHGGQNVAIGQHSGQDSQGGYNVFIGSNVARRMASGDLNVIIGAEAYNDNDQLGGSGMVLIGAYVRNSGNYDDVISIKGEEPTAAKQIRIGKADFSAFIIGNKKLNFNQDGTVTWEDVTPTP